ncbi:MAG: RNA-binding transcriptional accessory protein [Salinivirgaceae bacterium]|nr:RNA-binding transcriptional accessory protein [Salinivirgaceae bacterium]
MHKYFNAIANALGIKLKQVEAVTELLDGGATVPFISRYRKEATDGLDEVAIFSIETQYKKFQELDRRKQTIIETIVAQDKMTDELKRKIDDTLDSSELEDIYLPYKPKKRTRATVAKEQGLEPLAAWLMKQNNGDAELMAEKYLKGDIDDTEKALAGARDIIAEWVSEDMTARQRVRNYYNHGAQVISHVIKGKESDAVKYEDYYDFAEPLRKCPSHRMLAMRRGEAEGYLRINIEPKNDDAVEMLSRHFLKADNAAARQVRMAVEDSYKRLIQPSIENEFKKIAKEKADKEAIDVFSVNLRQLLLAAPLGQKRILALDPGFRTGCKVVCLDQTGNLLHNQAIYPHPPQNEWAESQETVRQLVKKYHCEAIAIGNGTASRETEAFVRSIKFDTEVQIFVVSENGASVYSASQAARDEFPDYDVTVRGAVSIGRRLMDPLAELVKIDPKSIGVGQYQHDVDQTALKESLDFVVESCVNQVGVNLNTASKHLLAYVSGLGEKLAQNIIDYRTENGAFASRQQLKKVPRLGDKAFEQCAAFLRIPGAKNPLDNSAVHPESYAVVDRMAADLDCKVQDLIADASLRQKIDLKRYVSGTIGMPTLQDIKKELEKPGRDPRSAIKEFAFAEGVHTIDDLEEDMVLPGIVTNITNFGAFVDIGVHQDGLVHISQLANKYVGNPNDVVSLHQHVMVKVVGVDYLRGRISLSMKGVEQGE